MLKRYELTDQEWNQIALLLPPEKSNRPGVLLRITARCSMLWYGLHAVARYGPWETVYSRFRKWIEDGFLDNIFHVLSLEAELEELSMDASIVKAHQHSAGAKKGGQQI